MAEAKCFLPSEQGSLTGANAGRNGPDEESSIDNHIAKQSEAQGDSGDSHEDLEAAFTLQQILDELSTETDHPENGSNSGHMSTDHYEIRHGSTFSEDDHYGKETPLFPSAPTHVPPSEKIIDDLLLPSAPTTTPTAPSFNKIGKHTDSEIDTWCIICLADATLRCQGCTGDLYCSLCWKEGHTGPDAGYEERRHKAVALRRNTVVTK